MKNRTPIAWTGALAVTLGVLAASAITWAGSNGSYNVDYNGTGRYLVPKSRVIAFDDGVALLDTTTGAIYEFVGDLRNPRANGAWELHVAPVRESTSGVLQIQKPEGVNTHGDATFLVDMVNGDTWLLYRESSRDSRRATWLPVRVQR